MQAHPGTGCLVLRVLLNLSELKFPPQKSHGTVPTFSELGVGCSVKTHSSDFSVKDPSPFTPPLLKREQTWGTHGLKESQMEPWTDQK